ncbi:AraC family transcriptional regulator [Halanaerobium saccharolyticum]|uniref:AraC family transcriptional regulator n=1 Tax=Halanaerobium saccharolyticum TaxID=43595 RepID=A0A4R6LUE6_9FIRM|nr:AraC family transcriptional regulator [Halanaerobium saccharolyticum]TDO91321.1 AraC family transcriptional regulator [Halanaerobium saccharolyticum]
MSGIHEFFSNQNFNAHYTKAMVEKKYEFYDVHIHDMFEIYYFIQGDVNYHIEGHVYQVEAGDLLLINNKEIHRPVFNSDILYERITIHFAPWYFSKFNSEDFSILDCFENREPGYYNRISAKKIKENNIDYYLNKIKEFLSKKEKGKEIMIETYFVQLLYHLNKIFNKDEIEHQESIQYNEKITKLIRYINDNLNQKFDLDTLAKMFYLDKYYLAHLFKENTGFSILQYINYKKIMKAKELLAKNYTCSQVADKLSFGNYSNFYKTFTKEVGMAPSKYQKENSL